MLEMIVPSQIGFIDQITNAVNELLSRNACPPSDQSRIDVVLDELFSNICRYAYPPESGSVMIQAEIIQQPKGIRICLIDSGIPYDPTRHEAPRVDIPAKERPIGGLGIMMVQKMMNEVFYEYRNGHNRISIIKYFNIPKG